MRGLRLASNILGVFVVACQVSCATSNCESTCRSVSGPSASKSRTDELRGLEWDLGAVADYQSQEQFESAMARLEGARLVVLGCPMSMGDGKDGARRFLLVPCASLGKWGEAKDPVPPYSRRLVVEMVLPGPLPRMGDNVRVSGAFHRGSVEDGVLLWAWGSLRDATIEYSLRR